MALSDPIRYHLAGEVHELGSRGINARHPLFGARGDYNPFNAASAGTDDTAALQAWIDYGEELYDAMKRGELHREPAPPPPPGGQARRPLPDYTDVVCVLPAGNYKVSGTLTLHRPLRLQGAGWGEAIIHATTDAPILNYERQVDTLQVRAVIRGIGFEGTHVKFSSNTFPPAPQTPRANQHGIKVSRYGAGFLNDYLDVEDCRFYGLGGAGVYSYYDETTSADALGDKFRIRGCHFAVCGDFGIRLEGRHATAYITGNHIHDCAGGIALLGKLAADGKPALWASTSVIEGNIIESNVTGSDSPGSASNPGVGIMLRQVFIARIERNYFEGHLNGVYLTHTCRGIQIVRNHFDGADVNLPRNHRRATGNRIVRQLSPVYWDSSAHSDVVVEENDVYVPKRPAFTDEENAEETQMEVLDWSPQGTWGEVYPVFPSIHGHAHQLIRNVARIAGGVELDATYQAGSEGKMYYESVAPIPGPDGLVGVQLRQIAGRYRYESSDALAGVYHDFIYPAALGPRDPLRVRHALWARGTDGSLDLKRVVSSIGDAGWSFYGDVQMHGSVIGNGWRTLAQVSKNPGAATLSYSNLAAAPGVSTGATSEDRADGPLLRTPTNGTINNVAGVLSSGFAVVQPSWLPEYTTTLVLGPAVDFVRVWAGLFSADPGGHAAPPIRIAAFRYDTTLDGTVWRCVTSDGTNRTETATTVAITAGQRYQLRVRFVDAGTVEFYINGAWATTHASNTPGTALPLGFANRVTALTASVRDIRTGRIAVSHNS